MLRRIKKTNKNSKKMNKIKNQSKLITNFYRITTQTLILVIHFHQVNKLLNKRRMKKTKKISRNNKLKIQRIKIRKMISKTIIISNKILDDFSFFKFSNSGFNL